MGTSPAVASIAIETRTIRKVRMRIIPLVFALFVVAALDRNNIGFAALTMNRELAISSQQYGFIAGIFFFGYFIFERYPATCCCTRWERVSGLPAY